MRCPSVPRRPVRRRPSKGPHVPPNKRLALLSVGLAGALVATVITVASTAHAATLFSDDFNDGNANGWTKSGGSWSVVTDGSPVYRQTGTGSDAKAQTGSAWTGQA